MPKVSVIISVFNCKAYVEDCIRSVSGQSEGDIEVIVVDDGSTDGTSEILRRLASTDQRIVVYSQAHSGSPAVGRNLGLTRAKGRYIAFLDGDDLYHPDKLRRGVQLFEAFKHVDIVFHDMQRFRFHPDEADSYSFFARMNLFTVAGDYLQDVGNGNYICRRDFYVFASVRFCPFHTSSIMFRRELLASESVWFRKEMLIGEDVDLWYRLSKNRHVALINEELSYYRVTPGSLVSDPVRYLRGSAEAHSENLRFGMDLFSDQEVRMYRSRIGQYLLELGYEYFCRLNYSDSRKAYKQSLSFDFRAKTLAAYLKTFLPERLVLARRRLSYEWSGKRISGVR